MYSKIAARDLWIGFGAFMMIFVASLQQGEAREPRPYCYQGDRATTGGTLDCSYHTWEQCLATASGNGGGCSINPALGWRALERGPNRYSAPMRRYPQIR